MLDVKDMSRDLKNLIRFIEALTPSEEDINDGLRKENSLSYINGYSRSCSQCSYIHQDFSITGTGPTIEIFQKSY